MNTLFTFKARVILLSLLICQLGLKVHGSTIIRLVRTTDTTIIKKADTAQHVMKADTTLVVKAGATIVKRSDTTLVIGGDTALIKKITALAAKTDPATTASPATTLSTGTAAVKPDPATTLSTSPAAATTDPATTLGTGAAAAKSVPAAAATAGAATTGTTTIAPPTDGIIEVRNTAAAPPTDGLIEVKNSSGEIQVLNSNENLVGKPDSAHKQKTDSALTKTTAPAPEKVADVTPPVKDTAKVTKTEPALTATTDTTIKKADTLAKKADTTLAKKADTLAKTADTLAKKADSTLTKKSDTTLVKKDTTTEVTEIKAQSAFLEVGGAGLAISANYDTRFNKSRNGWGYRIGAGYFASGGNTVFTLPFQVNYLIGEHSHMIEFGAGTTFLNSTGTNVGNSKWEFDKVTGFIATASIGYRYQPAHRGLNFRIAFVPILYDEGIIPAGGVSVGYTFK